jgi:hypothetical protein
VLGALQAFEEIGRGSTCILKKKTVPRAIFIKHQLVTPENIDRVYPKDALLSGGDQ